MTREFFSLGLRSLGSQDQVARAFDRSEFSSHVGAHGKKALTRSSLFGLSAFLFATNVFATPTFPGVIQSELGLAERPDCELCHSGGVTGRGTVNTPFGKSLRDRGLSAGNQSSLKTAIAALTAEKTDSDADGKGDIEELKTDADPNVSSAGGGGTPVEAPEYGCIGRVGAASNASRGLAFLMLGFGLVLRRRSSRA
ncbi:MAG: hypothetical protein KBF88_05810 [Polyangiaceae bacterium]|nr:hypothetical protein [Polyangiaceae bacterium]